MISGGVTDGRESPRGNCRVRENRRPGKRKELSQVWPRIRMRVPRHFSRRFAHGAEILSTVGPDTKPSETTMCAGVLPGARDPTVSAEACLGPPSASGSCSGSASYLLSPARPSALSSILERVLFWVCPATHSRHPSVGPHGCLHFVKRVSAVSLRGRHPSTGITGILPIGGGTLSKSFLVQMLRWACPV